MTRTYEAWFVNSEGDPVDLEENLPIDGWELREQAEEGSVPTSTIPVADPDSEIDLDGNRAFVVIEPESEADDNVLYGGYLWTQRVGREADEFFEPLGRAWSAATNDRNAYWQRVVMRGADCNRSAETDVERAEWALGTSEAATFDNVTDWVHSGSPVNMDAVDYRGQTIGQVMQDCAEAGGKNWWVKLLETGAGRELWVWYGKDSEDSYDSPLALSNEPADWSDAALLDGTSLVWPVSEDTEVERDPSRIVCGIYAQYDGGATYRHDTDTHDAYGHRDMVVPMPNVKSLAKAQARADRMLAELDTQFIRITTRVRLPKGKATMLRAGMRVSVRLTHVPGFETPKWCRVLACSVSPVAVASAYDLTLELVPTGPPDPGDDGLFQGAAFAGLQLSQEYDPGDNLGYKTDGDNPESGWYATPLVGPFSIVEGSEPFLSIECEANMVVRIEANAFFTTVASDASVTMNVESSIQGVLDTANDSYVGGLTSFNGTLQIEIPSVTVEAGEIITVTGSYTGFLTGGWSNTGNNTTYLRIGRGTHYWDVGGSVVWVGPS